MGTLTKMPAEEVVRRGKEIYNQKIRPIVERDNIGRYLAIDVLTGDYEIGGSYLDRDTRLATSESLRVRRPDAVVYLLLIGYNATGAIGNTISRVPLLARIIHVQV